MFESVATRERQHPALGPAGFPAPDPGGFTTTEVGFSTLDPAVDPVGFLTAATKALAKLPSNLWRTGNDGFAAIAAGMDALAVQLDCARVGLVQEAESRGVVDQSPSPSAADWLTTHSFHLEPGDASRTAKLAHLCAQPRNQIMAAAVAGGTVTVRKAMTALRHLAQVEQRAIRGQLDPESAAVLAAALDPLSAPNPTAENGGRDPRPDDRRRTDALIELCRRAVAAGGAAPATTKAQIVVIIDKDVLTRAVRGAGTTLTGDVLSPQSVRKLACDASIIPPRQPKPTPGRRTNQTPGHPGTTGSTVDSR